MKKLLILAVAAIAAGAGTAHAQKGAPTTVLYGGKGVTSPDGKIRYVATTTGQQTIVSVVRVRGGHVEHRRQLLGAFGVPVVSLDGTTDGVSRDGRTLVLATPAGGSTTQFAVFDTRSWTSRRITLRGLWSFDAIAPNASTLYLIRYTGTRADAAYSVRAFDLRTNRLLSRPVVDREIGAKLMRGWPVTRATSVNGRWAYTLYARQGYQPFVHALDTVRRQAYCIDLPLELDQSVQMALRLRLRAGRLEVRSGRTTLAAVDTRSFVVNRH